VVNHPLYPHLHESTIPLLDLGNEERKERCEEKRWIPYDGARKAYGRLEKLLSCRRQQRPECMLLAAPTGNGKSMILEEFRDNHLAEDNIEGEAAHVPVLYLCIPEEPSLNLIWMMILDLLCSPVNPSSTKADRRREVYSLLERTQVKVLLVDELHQLSHASSEERLKILSFFKMLGNVPRIHVAAAGTQEAKNMLQSDPQLLNRFDIYSLPLWSDGEGFRVLLASFESLMPLRRPSWLGQTDALAHYILRKSDGMIGEIFKLLYRASHLAIDSGKEAITLEILRAVDYKSPTERKVTIAEIEV
jgi:type II secretory pathway predicted ATPase ExeA